MWTLATPALTTLTALPVGLESRGVLQSCPTRRPHTTGPAAWPSRRRFLRDPLTWEVQKGGSRRPRASDPVESKMLGSVGDCRRKTEPRRTMSA